MLAVVVAGRMYALVVNPVLVVLVAVEQVALRVWLVPQIQVVAVAVVRAEYLLPPVRLAVQVLSS
jgi:hypothetical protein